MTTARTDKERVQAAANAAPANTEDALPQSGGSYIRTPDGQLLPNVAQPAETDQDKE